MDLQSEQIALSTIDDMVEISLKLIVVKSIIPHTAHRIFDEILNVVEFESPLRTIEYLPLTMNQSEAEPCAKDIWMTGVVPVVSKPSGYTPLISPQDR